MTTLLPHAVIGRVLGCKGASPPPPHTHTAPEVGKCSLRLRTTGAGSGGMGRGPRVCDEARAVCFAGSRTRTSRTTSKEAMEELRVEWGPVGWI